jgi:uncharacterized protein YhaN
MKYKTTRASGHYLKKLSHSFVLFAKGESAIGTRNLPPLLYDLFVYFDDERTRVGLLVLVQICSRMQVLLFTHHERIAEQAVEVISNDKLKVQVLTH